MLTWKLPKLLGIQQVPKVFHEDSILFGYRHPRSSATDCIISVFQMTNETLNIWTHFLPTWYFLWKLLALLYTLDVWTDRYAWPLVLYMVSCCLYPFTSSCAHTFSVMSVRARHICFFFDYGALSLYSLGSAVAYSAYVFPDRWLNSSYHQYYVPLAVTNSIVCTGMSCYSRLGLPFLHYNRDIIERFPETERPRLSKVMRVLAFAYPYLFDSIPLFYRLYLCTGDGCTENDACAAHRWHIGLAFLTGFLFATHLPERLAPGCFDYIGHSHQLFHVCAVIGTHFQMEALITDMSQRQSVLTAAAPLPSFIHTVGAVWMCIAVSLALITAFSSALYWKPRTSSNSKQS
ncbi:membrane progestin receptor gamma isoform X1 [Pleurodeles waltl]|uniref:membrane progestin receptor gamma isoform X1 n=1 Tax=Pleurodeles waltl TaxID=8319 RepID=UPI0037099020